MVSYLDKDFAVLYHCNKVLADGTCEKLHHYVSVIARKHRLRGEALQRKDSILRQYLPDMCTDPMDIADITHTGTERKKNLLFIKLNTSPFTTHIIVIW